MPPGQQMCLPRTHRWVFVHLLYCRPQVLLWDHRAAASGPVSHFTVPPPAPGAAASMVTCLDASGSALLCGTTTQLVTQWDLRCGLDPCGRFACSLQCGQG